MKKTYLVQTWAADGTLKNHYSVVLESERERTALAKFLKKKGGHVLITRESDAPTRTPFKKRR